MGEFAGFAEIDFEVFTLPTVDDRMNGIKAGPRPKLEALGRDLAPELGAMCGHPMHPIVARHARRKVNPPDDTWVAWSPGKRGYKMLPHFQVGLWHTHAFIQAGVIYEAEARAQFAENLLAHLRQVRQAILPHSRWLEDHIRPDGILHRDMTDADFERIAHRLKTRKEADCMCGLSLGRAEVVRQGPAFADTALEAMRLLLPLYALAQAPVTL